MNKEWTKLIDQIIEQVGWGPVSAWQGGDFRKLNQLIFEKTHLNISKSTLRRLFGKSDYPHAPNETTLNTLAIFAGYASWRDFRSQAQKPSGKFALKKKMVFAGSAISGLLIIFVILYHFGGKPADLTGGYDFTSKTVTRAIPNSVIFHYKAPAKTAQLYIQQSWDNTTRTKVASDGDTYTSVYYRPASTRQN